jgi:hypothetical protein
MTSDDSGGPGPGPAARGEPSDEPRDAHGAETASRACSPLVLELVIAGTEPLSGTVGPAGSQARLDFHGWIDLMSAISTFGASHAGNPAAPE